jgi:hypothetical protein
MTATIRACRKSREEIAEELSARTGQRVTVAMLNDYSAESKKPARFPACFLQAFSEIVGSDALQLFVLSDRQRHLLELGEQAERLVLTASRKRKKE